MSPADARLAQLRLEVEQARLAVRAAKLEPKTAAFSGLVNGVLRNWGLVFVGNFAGAFTVALLMAVVVTYGFSTEPNAVGKAIGVIG